MGLMAYEGAREPYIAGRGGRGRQDVKEKLRFQNALYRHQQAIYANLLHTILVVSSRNKIPLHLPTRFLLVSMASSQAHVVNDLEAASQWATAHLVGHGESKDNDDVDEEGGGGKDDPDELDLEEEEENDEDDKGTTVQPKGDGGETEDEDESSSDSDSDSETEDDIRRKVALLDKMEAEEEDGAPSSAPRTANELCDDGSPHQADPTSNDMAAKAGQDGIRAAGVIKFHMVEDRTVVIER